MIHKVKKFGKNNLTMIENNDKLVYNGVHICKRFISQGKSLHGSIQPLINNNKERSKHIQNFNKKQQSK